MKKNKIPTILGIIFLVFGLAAGILLVQNRQIFRISASPQASPKDIRITNITDSSFTVSWATDKATGGFTLWGETQNSLTKTELNEIGETSNTHSATIQGLFPNKTYFFELNSDGVSFDNDGIPWQITTGPKFASQSTSNSISGTILTATGTPAKEVIVYVTLAGGSPLSTTTSQNGSWVIPISSTRNQNLTSYLEIDETNTLIEISVQAGPQGVATAQIYPASARPAPPIILGESMDFRNEPPSESGGIPKANINLPDGSAQSSSGFEVPGENASPSAETVTLENIEEGEAITSTEPEFFGEGPPGTTITITIESDPITDQTVISSLGDWSWSPPEGLTEGSHKITISWRDTSGILRTLTRTFIVQASEGPAFESTPSATPTSTPTASPTATPAPAASSSPTVSATPISTASGIPDSGNLKPTILYSIMGLALIVFSLTLGFFTFRKT